jgi:ADP-Ribosyltransferase in polyvalent proteins
LSLSGCIGKAGEALRVEDREALLARALELRNQFREDGMGQSAAADKAARQAVMERLGTVQTALADAIDSKEWADADVAGFVSRAEAVSKGGKAKFGTDGAVFGRNSDAWVTNELKDAIQRWDGPEVKKVAAPMERMRALKQLRAALADDAMSRDAKHMLAFNLNARSYEIAPASGKFGDGQANAAIDMRSRLALSGKRHDAMALPYGAEFAVVVDGRVVNTQPTVAEAEKSAEFTDAEFWRGEIESAPDRWPKWSAGGSPLSRATAAGALFQRAPQTDTEAFRKWFGDSKVADAAGKPLVVYHGTAQAMVGGAFYFSHSSLMKNPATNANDYARNRSGDAPNVIPVYLRIENPFVAGFTEPMPEGDAAIGAWLDRMQKFNRSIDMSKEQYYKRAIKEARAAGHDGVIIKNVEDVANDAGRRFTDEADVYIAFEPTQIKSAIGNNGAFDPANPNILNSRGAPGDGASREPLAEIRFPSAGIASGVSAISLFRGANLSSFIHESGHLFLEIHSDLAQRIQQQIDSGGSVSDGERGILDDFNAVLKWMGITGAEPASGATGGALKQSAYHGTPHRGIDKFSTDKIGTGEGAQAYGWGLYFATKKEIAEHYRKALAGNNYTLNGQSLNSLPSITVSPERAIIEKFVVSTDPRGEGMTPEQAVERIRRDAAQTLAKSKENLAEVRANVGKTVDAGEGWGSLRQFTYTEDMIPEQERSVAYAEKFVEMAQALTPDSVQKNPGQLYEVDIPEDSEMLLWDRPLSEQPEKVRAQLDAVADGLYWDAVAKWAGMSRAQLDAAPQADKDAAMDKFESVAASGSRYAGTPEYPPQTRSSMTGEDYYRDLTAYFKDQATASEAMLSAGIKGIKYLDGTSRSAGDGSYNYVIFSGDDVAIRQTFYQGGNDITPPSPPPLGRTPLETWSMMSMEQKTPYHELWAVTFEHYTFEGNAPSLELQSTFRRFRSFMLEVYKKALRAAKGKFGKALGTRINDDIRRVMDRMLATDDAIAEAESARGMSPMFKTYEEAKALGWSKDEFDAYHALSDEPTAAAIEALQLRGMKDMKWLSGARTKALRERQAEVEEQRREVRMEIRAVPDRQAVACARERADGRVQGRA